MAATTSVTLKREPAPSVRIPSAPARLLVETRVSLVLSLIRGLVPVVTEKMETNVRQSFLPLPACSARKLHPIRHAEQKGCWAHVANRYLMRGGDRNGTVKFTGPAAERRRPGLLLGPTASSPGRGQQRKPARVGGSGWGCPGPLGGSPDAISGSRLAPGRAARCGRSDTPHARPAGR